MIDHYCERVGPGLLAEPLNAISSLAFIAVALPAWRYLARERVSAWGAATLAGLIAAIACASLAWHSLATAWARWLDIFALLAFQVAWLWIYVRRVIGFAPRPAGLVLLVFALSLVPAAAQASSTNGLLLYLPTLAMLFALGLHRRLRLRREPNLLLVAAVIFALALGLRTLDASLCAAIPVGTHFAWHLLGALAAWFALRSLSAEFRVAGPGKAG